MTAGGREEWEAQNMQAVISGKFGLRKRNFVTGDFSGFSPLTFPLNTGGIGYDPPDEPNTWEYEASQGVDRRIATLAREVGEACPKLDLPRTPRDLTQQERAVLATRFGNDLGGWNVYLSGLRTEYGSVHPVGVAVYIRETGEMP